MTTSVQISSADVEIARNNWQRWQNVYEHEGPAETNPLLMDSRRFAAFMHEYYVYRNIRAGAADELRQELITACPRLLDITTFEREHDRLRVKYGAGNGRQIRTLLSKVLAFLKPQSFNACDRFARYGVNLVLDRSPHRAFASYGDYLADVDTLLQGNLGALVRDACIAHWRDDRISKMRRVLDVALMRIGGRKSDEFAR